MLKTMRDMLLGAVVAAMVGGAVAAVGVAPGSGPQLIDGAWLNGVVGGQNFTYQSGITAHAGGTQAACLNLNPGIYLYELDTVASSGDSICVPFAQVGTNFSIRNAGAQSANLFAQSGTNLLTATTDQINGSSNASAYALPANQSAECFVAKNGQWSCVHGN